MNTLRNELDGTLTDVANQKTGIYQARQDLLSAIKNRLPKEKKKDTLPPETDDLMQSTRDIAFVAQQVGFNTCLAEVKQALDIESE